jgi:hypothetical protein
MKKVLIIAVIFLAFCGIIGSCSDSSSNSKYSGYSKTYNEDSEYRQNIKKIADAYGVTEKEVDRKINAVTGGK